MTGHQAVRRLMAFAAGKPLPHGETLCVPKPGRTLVPDDALVVAFVRMGGESSPWGVAFGHPGRKPDVLMVPEARTRDYVADMMAEFAPVLLRHVLHPRFDDAGKVEVIGGKRPELPLRQIWVPNRSHLEMLHCIAYAYHRTRYGSAARQELLRALARACGWLFREANRPGQLFTMVATDVLSEAYTFPADDLRQGHLGFLLAWLNTKGRRGGRLAAAEEAERQSMSTSLDPEFERTELAPDVETFNDARAGDDEQRMKGPERRIRKSLTGELVHRWELTCEAIQVIERDRRRENLGVGRLVKATQDEHYRQYLRIEQKFDDPEDGPAFTPSPETDLYPAAAASRYYVCASSDELRDRLLVHDDREMQAELVASGEALNGTMVEIATAKEGGKTRVYWTVDTDGRLPLRLREGGFLCPLGCDRRQVQILSIEQPDPETNRFEFEVTKGKTLHEPPNLKRADNRALVGSRVTLVAPPMDGIARRKSVAIWNRDVPGSWLTHARPRGTGSDLPDDVAEDSSEVTKR